MVCQWVFSKRKVAVEAVFAYLKGIQGLNRFRRKGLAKVKLKFGFHLLGYKLSRAVKSKIYAILCTNRLFWLLSSIGHLIANQQTGREAK